MITYFLLCGYTPFDKDNSIAEIQAICKADYKFEPQEYWKNVSNLARDFIAKCLTVSSEERLTSQAALAHPWFESVGEPGVVDPASHNGETQNLLPQLKRQFDAKKTFRKAIATVRASNRFMQGTGMPSNEVVELMREVEKGQAEAAAETVDQVLATE